ncbi:YehS family protein [Aureibacter tunicatorum]|uniref:Uncharacterized protein YehS (DUF1456 family) n=1 Tax=Aureibacter tunicatorum TaxID=866807 RepID=A0AAE3XJR3_9BACT|nr:DUF1456 family protein [Aureibacter tunicatorum]MDR6237740.1 uncharacterized protein YehS (DUF1456 family) [Aureibacter tunicatorum]BDD02775.1 DUF1456 domain-containing protein [Aureibacter tunicatorum]
MKNNDILRRLRYTFDMGDDEMMRTFALAGKDVSRSLVSDWLKKDDHEEHVEMLDKDLAVFLNGMIIARRGMKDGEIPKPEKSLNNNQVFRKLKIALSMRDEDILEIFKLVKFDVGRHELSAIFRNPKQSQYRKCKDQFLRNFLLGLQQKNKRDIVK